jgi:hypothetical protein
MLTLSSQGYPKHTLIRACKRRFEKFNCYLFPDYSALPSLYEGHTAFAVSVTHRLIIWEAVDEPIETLYRVGESKEMVTEDKSATISFGARTSMGFTYLRLFELL